LEPIQQISNDLSPIQAQARPQRKNLGVSISGRCLDGRVQLLVAIGQLGPASLLILHLPCTQVEVGCALGAKVEGLPQASANAKGEHLKRIRGNQLGLRFSVEIGKPMLLYKVGGMGIR